MKKKNLCLLVPVLSLFVNAAFASAPIMELRPTEEKFSYDDDDRHYAPVSGSATPTDGKYSYDASGIGAPSWPLFLDKNERVSVVKRGHDSNAYWTLTGTGSKTSFWGSLTNSINLTDESVKYVANFNAKGELITSIGSGSHQITLTNYLEINGTLAAGQFGDTAWGDQPNQLLLKATLHDSNRENSTPDLIGNYKNSALGFGTEFTGGWAAANMGLTGGSTGENLWLFSKNDDFLKLIKALDGNKRNGTLESLIGSSRTFTNVSSISAVPVPAAVWMFLTGMLALIGVSRKNSSGFVLKS